jgi:hypothetical protein
MANFIKESRLDVGKILHVRVRHALAYVRYPYVMMIEYEEPVSLWMYPGYYIYYNTQNRRFLLQHESDVREVIAYLNEKRGFRFRIEDSTRDERT